MAPDSKESNGNANEDSGSKALNEAGGPPSLHPSGFPGEIELSISTSTSSISKAEADFRRWLQKWGAVVLLALTLVTSGMAVWLIFQTARNGSQDGQKLAFGLIGTVLGVLWSNFAKLIESASKR